jgi:hypothetical protein
LSLKGKLSYDPKTGFSTSTLEEKKAVAYGYVGYNDISSSPPESINKGPSGPLFILYSGDF